MGNQPIIAIDLETTGLDRENDSIIEIGAVKFQGQRFIDEWHSLINPERRIPLQITPITNITDAMVRNSPTIHEVVDDLLDFIGEDPILGHNIRFDLAFLKRYGRFQYNEVMDTYEIASVLYPTAGRYNLGILARELGILIPATHRALDDARVTAAVYQHFFEEALHLPIDLIAEITRMADSVINWDGFYFFYQVMEQRARTPITSKKIHAKTTHIFENASFPKITNISTNIEPIPLDIDEIASSLEHGGAFSKHFPGYEYRHEQVTMLRAVAEAFSKGRHLLVEAGTGVGKSLAYLIPAAVFATKNNTRVVISTNTINLQDQLINKDIPDLKKAMDIDLNATVLKGRNNYLCPRKLQIMRKRGAETPAEMRVLGKILVWLHQGGNGDKNEININGQDESEVWARLSAADEQCTTEICKTRMGGACPFYQAKQAAQNAHLIIVNHALLLSDIATGNRVLPDYDYLIIDEAHQLESATTNAMSFNISQFDTIRILREIGGKKSGTSGLFLKTMKQILPPDNVLIVEELVNGLLDKAFQAESIIRNFFATIDSFLSEQREGSPLRTYAQQVRITPAVRTQPSWMDVEVAWEDTHLIFSKMLDRIKSMIDALTQTKQEHLEHQEILEDVRTSLVAVYSHLTEIDTNIDTLIFNPDSEKIYWIEIYPNTRNVTLHAAPLHIGKLVEKYLWYEKQSVVLTSATLTTNGEFDYIKGRINADETYELAVGSPFDYQSSTLLYIVNDIPEPNDRVRYQRAVEQVLIQLTKALGGKTLALFTSYAQLKKTSWAINHALTKEGINIYEQGEGSSPHSLLETFKLSEHAILLGTRAFWEGVDIPGEALSALVIVRLPFDVPSDPIVSARAETFDDPFYQFSLPEAILRFRQGFGRLIRTKSDRGIVVVLDQRIINKPYGKYFIDSIPACTTKIASMHQLPREAQQWLNL